MNESLPWHQSQWKSLSERLALDTLPHALMFAGPHGIGKNIFAANFVQALLCEERGAEGQPCGRCRACQLYAAGNHPDFKLLAPPEPGKVIGIDQVREACAYLSLKPHYGKYKAVIISPADQMNKASANSLLKTLEEPSPAAVLILITTHPAALPATVVSRCQQLKFTPPPEDQAINWLAQRLEATHDPATLLAWAGGSPLTALAMADKNMLQWRASLLDDLRSLANGAGDPVLIASTRLKNDAKETLYWMQSWIMDMIRLQAGAGLSDVKNRDVGVELQELALQVHTQTLYKYLDRLNEARQMMETQINTQLLLESILMEWAACFAAARRYKYQRTQTESSV